jgi:hypothetical protein
MADIYVEPRPKGRSDGAPITHYTLEFAHGVQVGGNFPTQEAVANYAREVGHRPLCARVRNTDKGNPDHWRAC